MPAIAVRCRRISEGYPRLGISTTKLPSADGRSRRQAVITDREGERRSWEGSWSSTTGADPTSFPQDHIISASRHFLPRSEPQGKLPRREGCEAWPPPFRKFFASAGVDEDAKPNPGNDCAPGRGQFRAPRRRNSLRLEPPHRSAAYAQDRRASRIQLRDDASTAWRSAVVVHLPADGKTGGEAPPAQSRIHFRFTPGLPARISLAARNYSRPRFATSFQVTRQARGEGWHRRLHPKAEVDAMADLRSKASRKSPPKSPFRIAHDAAGTPIDLS